MQAAACVIIPHMDQLNERQIKEVCNVGICTILHDSIAKSASWKEMWNFSLDNAKDTKRWKHLKELICVPKKSINASES